MSAVVDGGRGTVAGPTPGANPGRGWERRSLAGESSGDHQRIVYVRIGAPKRAARLWFREF